MSARIRPAGRFHFAAFSGLGAYHIEPLSWRDSERDAAARFLRAARAEGYTVSVLESGRRYEVTGPDDSLMVSDNEGLLYLIPARPCLSCGEDTNGVSGAFEARECDGWICGRECARALAEREAEEQARFDAETAEDDGQGDDSEDETSVLWRPAASTMAAARKLFPGAF